MSENILVGTYGWLHPQWDSTVYEDDMPEAWRFCFYSNQHRSVIVPGPLWESMQAQTFQAWAEDCDEDFRFVHELSESYILRALSDTGAALDTLAQLVEPVRDRSSAWLVPLPADIPLQQPEWIQFIQGCRKMFPLCVDWGSQKTDRETDAWLSDQDISVCWRPERDREPRGSGDFLVVLTVETELKALRAMAEQVGQWMGVGRSAGIYFIDPATAYHKAVEARVMVELMGF